MARAELDELGPADGPVVTWTVPENFAQAQPTGARFVEFTPRPMPPSGGAPGWISWVGLACLLLLLVVVLLSRTRPNRPLR